MAEEKFETTIKGMDFAILGNAAVGLALCNLPLLIAREDRDEELIDLIKKSRQYLDIMFDAAIAQHDSKKKEEKSNDENK